MFFGQGEEAAQEAIHPFLGQSRGQGEGQKSRQRLAPHGSDVAQPAEQALMSNGLRTLPIPPKMHAFQAKIGGDQQLMTVRRAEDSGIVADALDQPTRAAGRQPPDALDQFSFSQGHSRMLAGGRQVPQGLPLDTGVHVP